MSDELETEDALRAWAKARRITISFRPASWTYSVQARLIYDGRVILDSGRMLFDSERCALDEIMRRVNVIRS